MQSWPCGSSFVLPCAASHRHPMMSLGIFGIDRAAMILALLLIIYFCAFISALFSLLSACTFCLLSFRSPSCIDFALPRSTFRAAISMNSYAFLYYSRCRQTKTWQDLSIRMGRPWRCQRKGPRRAAATMMVLLISPRSKQGRSAAPQGNEPKSLSRHLVSKC